MSHVKGWLKATLCRNWYFVKYVVLESLAMKFFRLCGHESNIDETQIFMCSTTQQETTTLELRTPNVFRVSCPTESYKSLNTTKIPQHMYHRNTMIAPGISMFWSHSFFFMWCCNVGCFLTDNGWRTSMSNYGLDFPLPNTACSPKWKIYFILCLEKESKWHHTTV